MSRRDDADDYEEEERPRKRRRHEEDDEDRDELPRRRREKKKGIAPWIWVVGGVGLLLVGGCCVSGMVFVSNLSRATTSEPLPKATTGLRTEAHDLYWHYMWQFGDAPKPHPHENKRILVKIAGMNSQAATFGNTKLVLNADGKPLTKRPSVVFVMRPDVELKNADRWGFVWVEGNLRGTAKYDAQEWSKKWLDLTPHSDRIPDKFVLVDDGVFVAEPKD